jgi:quercetin dioxygenase-like cupin family protein
MMRTRMDCINSDRRGSSGDAAWPRKVSSVIFALALSMGWALAQQGLPPGPAAVYRSDFIDAHRFDVVQLVLDFAPGAWTPSHTHGGLVYVTVLAGELTVREQGSDEQVYGAGASWTEYPGVFAEVGNAGAEGARILATFLLPAGAALTAIGHAGTTHDAPPGPTTVHRSTFENVTPLTTFDVVQLVLDFAPGAWTPLHTHGGEALVTVLAGEMTLQVEDGEASTYALGEQWLEVPGAFAAVGNEGTDPARIAVTFLLPTGAELTTVR